MVRGPAESVSRKFEPACLVAHQEARVVADVVVPRLHGEDEVIGVEVVDLRRAAAEAVLEQDRKSLDPGPHHGSRRCMVVEADDREEGVIPNQCLLGIRGGLSRRGELDHRHEREGAPFPQVVGLGDRPPPTEGALSWIARACPDSSSWLFCSQRRMVSRRREETGCDRALANRVLTRLLRISSGSGRAWIEKFPSTRGSTLNS